MEIDGLKYYQIGELASLVEMSPRTIRYYEEIGLINSVREVLPRLLELLDNHVTKIDERINNLLRLKIDILSYQEKIPQKLNMEDDSQKGEGFDERSGDHQRRPHSHR